MKRLTVWLMTVIERNAIPLSRALNPQQSAAQATVTAAANVAATIAAQQATMGGWTGRRRSNGRYVRVHVPHIWCLVKAVDVYLYSRA